MTEQTLEAMARIDLLLGHAGSQVVDLLAAEAQPVFGAMVLAEGLSAAFPPAGPVQMRHMAGLSLRECVEEAVREARAVDWAVFDATHGVMATDLRVSLGDCLRLVPAQPVGGVR